MGSRCGFCSLRARGLQLLRLSKRQEPIQSKTDAVATLNTILGRWGLHASPRWNISGEPCSGVAIDTTNVDNDPNINPSIKCDCSFNASTVCHITKLRVYALNVVGQIPAELQNLTYLNSLNLMQNYLFGPVPSFLGQFTALQDLSLAINPLSGPLPKELGNLTNLISLYFDSSGFSGPFPSTFSKLTNLRIMFASDIEFTGKIPDFLGSLTKLEDLRIGDIVNGSSSLDFIGNLTSLNVLILRNSRISDNLATVNFSKLAGLTLLDLSFNNITGQIPESILNLQNLRFLFLGNNSLSGSLPNAKSPSLNNLDLSYNQLSGSFPSWATESNLQFIVPSGLNCLQQDTPCFLGSPEWDPSCDLAFVQGDLKEKNFDIRKTAGGKSYTAVYKKYNATVSKNFLEIHLFWAGKGTCCIPTQGYYGPMISALSVTPDFTPTVRNGVPKKKSKTGAIAGIVIGAFLFGLAALAGIFVLVHKRRRAAQQQEELYNMVGRPNVFSNAELKLATDNFSPQNILGEGGYGAVYKGKLPDGRVIAVKQLSQTSHQGKSQFVTEVATISAVQHRNLVKLYGCCIDSNTPLLVYEYLENRSLDRALFGDRGLSLDWSTRFEIILGIARGLTYLHEESSVRIVHRDIKASNVLLDTDLIPKISDFGLAKLYDEEKTHLSTKVAGTFGYLAPEYAMRGHLTEKADVFAFGVVAMETVAGRSNTDNSLVENKVFLFEWAWELYETGQALGILDPRLEEEFESEEVLRVIHVALLCTQGSPHQRPPMSRVVAMLTGDSEVTEIVTKPSYITEWQLRGGNTSYVTTDYSGDTTREFSEQRDMFVPLKPSLVVTGVVDGGR
ncbi:hypothetical protein PR202_gb25429 [Eleusine coracana subsp. coracana]|uniref:non-specific serine/threonine protein kinase n=1 Tax=Eleusine coracana subsp. coracana TaxID=191504 RepID=A0AAV5FQJ9_ELECO|nr:hypothetical protein PR202_gb25429 [Eleusine coracana subsp. coracana]